MRSEVLRTLHPSNCPRNTWIDIKHHPTPASRLYHGNVSNTAFCPIIWRFATFYVRLTYDSIENIHCANRCDRCDKRKSKPEKSDESSSESQERIDVTDEFVRLGFKTKVPSK
jgi:hypothetical protein